MIVLCFDSIQKKYLKMELIKKKFFFKVMYFSK